MKTLKEFADSNVFAVELTAEEMDSVQGGSVLGLAVCCIGFADGGGYSGFC